MDFSGLKKMCFRHAIIRFLSNCVAFLIEKIRSDSKGRCICMNEKFMKEKPVFPLIMSMATPMVISMLVNSLYNIVDSFFVAKISEEAMMALSLVSPLVMLDLTCVSGSTRLCAFLYASISASLPIRFL